MKTRLLIIIFLTVSIMIPVNSFAEPPTKTENGSHEGTVEWMSRCFMIGSTVTVRVTDYDMNDDPNKIEQFNIKVWSDYDLESDFKDRIIDHTVTETGVNTGMFDSPVFLTTTDDSPGKRIRVIDNSTVFAKYVDYTVPNAINSDVTGIFTVSGLSVLERTDDSRMSKITYDPCAIVLFEKNKAKFNELDIFYPAPTKQTKSGLFPFEIKCKDHLELIFKHSDRSPACVNEDTKPKLIQRGWMKTQVDVYDDDAFVESTKVLDSVQYFLSLYPDAVINVDEEWFTVSYEETGFKEHPTSQIIQHTKRLTINLDYAGKPTPYTIQCGGSVSLSVHELESLLESLHNPDWCFPFDQSEFDSLDKEGFDYRK